ncbi:MAG: YqzL family protein [Alicyclobacillus sp.]|nr:YqzL family protein [Alicyclobacillus sp.]
MRDFSWRYFTLTGDIDAYLLYKRHEQIVRRQEQPDVEEDEREARPEP